MPTNYQQKIVKELEKINHKLDMFLMARMKDEPKPVSEDYIKLEMKSHMTPKYLINECKNLFPVWISYYADLGKVTSERKGNYTVYFKNVQESDEDLKGLSANDIKEKGMKTITLEERLLLEIVYFKETGNHLDVKNITLCAGSRYSDGGVPGADWRDDKFRVFWYNADHASDNIRSRSAVFFDEK